MQLTDIIQEQLWTLVQTILVIALPILFTYVTKWVNAQLKVVQANLTAEQRYFLESVSQTAVKVVEQLKANGVAELTVNPQAALDYAVSIVQHEVDAAGYPIDVASIVHAIEEAYRNNVVLATK